MEKCFFSLQLEICLDHFIKSNAGSNTLDEDGEVSGTLIAKQAIFGVVGAEIDILPFMKRKDFDKQKYAIANSISFPIQIAWITPDSRYVQNTTLYSQIHSQFRKFTQMTELQQWRKQYLSYLYQPLPERSVHKNV